MEAEPDNLIVRADMAISNAGQLRQELNGNIAMAKAQCHEARQAKLFQAGLHPAVSISLLVRVRE